MLNIGVEKPEESKAKGKGKTIAIEGSPIPSSSRTIPSSAVPGKPAKMVAKPISPFNKTKKRVAKAVTLTSKVHKRVASSSFNQLETGLKKRKVNMPKEMSEQDLEVLLESIIAMEHCNDAMTSALKASKTGLGALKKLVQSHLEDKNEKS